MRYKNRGEKDTVERENEVEEKKSGPGPPTHGPLDVFMGALQAGSQGPEPRTVDQPRRCQLDDARYESPVRGGLA